MQHLTSKLWYQSMVVVRSSWLKTIAIAFIGSWFLVASAKFTVPFYPVPMTLQTLIVLLIPGIWGMKIGLAAVTLYLAQGALGLPVFAKGGGIAYLMGPTGGFLIGFLVATVVIGYCLRHHPLSFWKVGGVLLLADGLLFACGLIQLSAFLNWDWQKTVDLGLIPFVLSDLSKVVIATAIISLINKRRLATL